MKKIILSLIVVFAAFAFQSCEKIKEIILDSNEITVTVNVDRGTLGTNGLHVQSLIEDVELTGSQCQIKVYLNDRPQVIAVTDDDNHVYMLFRGVVAENGSYTINAESTAQALVTFNPLLGPVPSSEYSTLLGKVTAAQGYSALRTLTTSYINNGTNLADAGNNDLIAAMATVIGSITDQAANAQAAIDNAVITQNSLVNAFPMLVTTESGELCLRASANCPTYTGVITAGEGEQVGTVRVPASDKYGFMNYFSSDAASTAYYGPKTYFDFAEEGNGNYNFLMTCTSQSALNDLCTRMMNYTAATLGVRVNSTIMSIVAEAVLNVLNQHGFSFDDAQGIDVASIISDSYDAVLNALIQQGQILQEDANWDLAGDLVSVYASNANVIAPMVCRVWNIASEALTQYDTVSFSVNYNNGTITAAK